MLAHLKSVKTDFRPDQTDVSNYQMNFAPPGVLSQDNHISLLMTLVPCPLKKLFLFACGKDRTATKTNQYVVTDQDGNTKAFEKNLKSINIADARKKDFGDFHESGFTLIKLEEDIDITDWRTPVSQNEDAEIKKFHSVMEPHIKKFYPDLKRMVWTRVVETDFTKSNKSQMPELF